MFCRTGLIARIPGLQMQGGVFARTGVFGWIVVFYFVGLLLRSFALADGRQLPRSKLANRQREIPRSS
jgi:hypothetical protein